MGFRRYRTAYSTLFCLLNPFRTFGSLRLPLVGKGNRKRNRLWCWNQLIWRENLFRVPQQYKTALSAHIIYRRAADCSPHMARNGVKPSSLQCSTALRVPSAKFEVR